MKQNDQTNIWQPESFQINSDVLFAQICILEQC